MTDGVVLHASRRRERQARRTVTLITAVVATRWICAALVAAVHGLVQTPHPRRRHLAGSAAALIARRRAS